MAQWPVVCNDTGEEVASYVEYMQSKHWAKLKQLFYKEHLEMLDCSMCRAKKWLDVHHITYNRLGREDLTDLLLVCQACHKSIHNLVKEKGISIGAATELWRRNQKQAKEKLWDEFRLPGLVGLPDPKKKHPPKLPKLDKAEQKRRSEAGKKQKRKKRKKPPTTHIPTATIIPKE